VRITPKIADRGMHAVIYLVLALSVVWAGGKVINFAMDFGFYRDFLMPWEVRLLEMRHRSIPMPAFKRNHPMGHMQAVVNLMKTNGMTLPNSNTEHAFVYRLNRFGGESSNILLVFNGRQIVIYGLPNTTFKRVDRFVDGRADTHGGDFTGRLSRDRSTFIGSWNL
jgi:hypothetical protein